MKDVIPVFRPSMGDEEIAAVADVIRSGWIGLGPKTQEFETAFARKVGAPFAVGTISCTAALELAIRLLDLRPGDEIIVPSLTFVSTAHVVVYNNCRPVFADVNRDTLNIDVNDVRSKITSRTRAIMPVHYAGRPADLGGILEAAGRIPVIEDCAHAAGGYYKGRHVGTFGKFGCFSFHAVKNLSMGEGGALVSADRDAIDRAKRLRWLGIDKGTWERTPDNKSYWWEYSVDEIGLKCHLNDILAAIGLVQLRKLDALNAKRRAIVARYREAFRDLEWIGMPPEDDETHKSAWHICCIRLGEGIDRDELSVFLKERGVLTGVHYKPIHLYKCYGHQPRLPVAEAAFPSLLTIPSHAAMSDEDVDRVIDAFRRYPR